MFDYLKSKSIIVNEYPIVGYIDDFATEDECTQIIELAKPKFVRSVVMGENGSISELDNRRTSSNTFLDNVSLSIPRQITERISDYVGFPASHAEQLSVLEYQIGQEYQPHYDGFDMSTKSGYVACRDGHQRIFTALLYLNTPDGGGETTFPNLHTKIEAVTGRLAFFSNIRETLDDRPNETLHGGAPVTAGVKYAATLWFHVRPRTEKYELPCESPALMPHWV